MNNVSSAQDKPLGGSVLKTTEFFSVKLCENTALENGKLINLFSQS